MGVLIGGRLEGARLGGRNMSRRERDEDVQSEGRKNEEIPVDMGVWRGRGRVCMALGVVKSGC